MKKMVKVSAALAMAGLMAFAAGCGGKKEAAKDAVKDTLKVGVTNFADSLEPTDNYFGWVVMRYGLGECITRFDESMKTVGWLSDKWQISDDKLTWTFHINDKAVFSNGNKVTGKAVADSFLRTFAKAPRAKSMFQYESITADGQNVIIKTKKPVPTLPGMLGDPLFIVIDTTVKDRDYAKMGPICTGPYAVKSFTKAKAVMVKNEKYWDGEVPFKTVEIPSIDDPNTRAMALQKGEIDVAVNIAAGDLALFQGKDKFKVSEIASLRDILGRLNVRQGRPLADPKVRHALMKCMDRETYAKALLKGTFFPGACLMPPSTDYDYKTLYASNPDKFDVEGAKKLLAEAGWKDTNGDGYVDKNGKNLELDCILYTSRAELPIYAEATQASAKQIGIKINLKPIDYNVLDKMTREGQYDISVCNTLSMQAGDPEVFVNMYLTTGQEQNGSGYSSPEYDALSAKLSVEFDPAKRRALVIEMQKVHLKDASMIVWGHPKTNMVASSKIANANIKPCDYYWVTKEIKVAK